MSDIDRAWLDWTLASDALRSGIRDHNAGLLPILDVMVLESRLRAARRRIEMIVAPNLSLPGYDANGSPVEG